MTKPQRKKLKQSPYRIGSDVFAMGLINTQRSQNVWQRTLRRIKKWNTFS